MKAYSKLYLYKIVENQGILFERISDCHKDADVKHFIEEYMKSKTRKYIDNAQPYVCTKSPIELLDYFMECDHFKFKKGEHIGGFIPDWLGQFYAYYQWYYNIPSRDLIELFPVDTMIRSYMGLHDLDLELAVQKVGESLSDDKSVVCFHNPNEPYGFLSNWYLSDFALDAVNYSSAEQYMMYQKAVLFNDMNTANKILKTNDVRLIKQLGREVKNYNDDIWDKERQSIVYRGLLAKFSQNDELKEKLLATEDSILAECAVKDRIWGIGLSMTDPNRFSLSKWKGRNLLGKTLMSVRDTIKS